MANVDRTGPDPIKGTSQVTIWSFKALSLAIHCFPANQSAPNLGNLNLRGKFFFAGSAPLQLKIFVFVNRSFIVLATK